MYGSLGSPERPGGVASHEQSQGREDTLLQARTLGLGGEVESLHEESSVAVPALVTCPPPLCLSMVAALEARPQAAEESRGEFWQEGMESWTVVGRWLPGGGRWRGLSTCWVARAACGHRRGGTSGPGPARPGPGHCTGCWVATWSTRTEARRKAMSGANLSQG